MRISHRGRRQRAAAQSPRKINLSVSVSPSLRPRLSLPSSFLLVRSALSDLLWVFLRSRDRVELPSDLGSAFSPSSSSHLHYEREDLLAIEYNADLSVSIHRDREPSSSRVPLRRGYTYPPSAARRIAARKRRREEEETRGEGGGQNGTGLSEYFAPGRVSSARVLLVRRKSRNRWPR